MFAYFFLFFQITCAFKFGSTWGLSAYITACSICSIKVKGGKKHAKFETHYLFLGNQATYKFYSLRLFFFLSACSSYKRMIGIDDILKKRKQVDIVQ